MSGSCWTPEAVEAASAHLAWWWRMTQTDDLMDPRSDASWWEEAAKVALAAAEPFLREALAREVEAIQTTDLAEAVALNRAAARLRAGVPAPEPASQTCSTCEGSGRSVAGFPCADCRGSGRVPAPEPTKGNT